MASSPPPPAMPPAPTTISSLNDDLLREIFLRLPAVTSLARAAFSCRAFLRAVRSSPAFRRRFRELHAPPLLAIFLVYYMRDFVVPTDGGKGSFRNPPAFANLLQYDADSEWWTESDNPSAIPYSCGYVSFINRTTEQRASYSPHSQVLQIWPKKPHVGDDTCLEFHMLSPDGEEQRPSRVVCVHYECSWAWARVASFSSDTVEWQISPMEWNSLAETGTLPLEFEEGAYWTGKIVSEFICWIHMREGRILALNTATFQFSQMDLPPALKSPFSESKLGETKDGKLCIVDVHECKISFWLWTADHDGVEKFMLHKIFPIQASVKEIIERSDVDTVEVEITMVINGFVYLSVSYLETQPPEPPGWFLSFCLETAEVNLLLTGISHLCCTIHPYILTSWPSSLIQNKHDSETGVIADISEDDGPTGTAMEETSPVLLTALHSFKETLIDDANVDFVEIDAFLLDDEKNSLVNRIIALESRLTTARESVLRIGAESDNKKGMERGSWWQMWKERLGRAWSQFFTG